MNNSMNDVVIIEAIRTPIGAYKGSLKELSADKLGSIVIKEILRKSKIDKDDIDEVIMGQVLTAGGGQNPARQAAINAGINISKPAHLVNQVCGSGLRAVISGYQSIKLGEAKNIISGGQENMSLAPHSIFYRDNKKILEKHLVDTMINDGLIDAFNNYHMGVTAENVAKKFNISRVEQDDFALNSQKKTETAINTNRFKEELIKINQSGINLEKDEHPRKDLNKSDLEKLKAVFLKDGTVTPGNSSGINDGAAALLLTTFAEAKKKSIQPLVKIISWASVGVDPTLMGIGPIEAVREAVKKAKWNLNDVDLFEINEAFAAQSIAVIRELNIDENKVNVNGGAIALGHPIGASGARILVTLIHEMIKQKKDKGCATLCIGGGMGIAICVERI
ncbi:acetyl-CoA C-acetyltransferase [Candidatus Pelagibacter sp. RS39]|uniref:acetyl-CoA C-acetyltransferase n=1 Tax=Candidatus Pelagibacter sp. RS39 TaxID=1977864 RepID=UPI000A169073|nr:acetyl-CoA C-acetyltransferase [Candidatus Pelagibacter sp. RS39]ARJ47373.1 acetyl-CoA acetyltransferase [Candidatus Pelagibacter sp. RS39]